MAELSQGGGQRYLVNGVGAALSTKYTGPPSGAYYPTPFVFLVSISFKVPNTDLDQMVAQAVDSFPELSP